jgi:hypothetical protein
MSTDEYGSEFEEREALRVFHHEERYHEREFGYGGCSPEKTCPEGEDCTQHVLPSLWELRSDKEKKILANLVTKVATGEKLTSIEKDLLRQFGEEDLKEAGLLAVEGAEDDVAKQIREFTALVDAGEDPMASDSPSNVVGYGLWDELMENAEKEEGFTVKELKEKYNTLLDGTFVSVDHLATVAGLGDDNHIVTEEEYEKFLKPECP